MRGSSGPDGYMPPRTRFRPKQEIWSTPRRLPWLGGCVPLGLVVARRPRPRRPFGRVRLYREDAELLVHVLFAELDLVKWGRKERPVGETATGYNGRAAGLKRVLHELERTKNEMGWDEAGAV